MTEETTVGSEGLGMVGLAKRAGAAVIGTRAVLAAARAGSLRAVVLSRDATENARQRLGTALGQAPAVICSGSRELGAAVGRGPVIVVGLTDSGFATRVLGDLASRNTGSGHPADKRKQEGR